MLHDISSYKSGIYVDHAKLSSIEARRITGELKCFNEEEIATICEMISNHSDKQSTDDIYSELLKDADVLQHYLYNTSFEINSHESKRLTRITKELGIALK